MFLEKSRIFLNILNIQNLITSLNAKVCKKSLARDFLPEEVHHLLIENISAVVFAIVAGQAGTDFYFHFRTSSILSRINRSAGSQSTERRVSFESQRAASCSRSFNSPDTIVHKMQCMVRWKVG